MWEKMFAKRARFRYGADFIKIFAGFPAIFNFIKFSIDSRFAFVL
jgi:hypothetical protein